jgi:hypothetical protein
VTCVPSRSQNEDPLCVQEQPVHERALADTGAAFVTGLEARKQQRFPAVIAICPRSGARPTARWTRSCVAAARRGMQCEQRMAAEGAGCDARPCVLCETPCARRCLP